MGLGGHQGCLGVFGAGREHKYSGARRGIGGIRVLIGVLGAVRGIRDVGVYWWLAGSVGTQGPEGV